MLLSTGLAITNPDMKNRTTQLVPTFFSFIPVFGTTCDQLVMALHNLKKILNEKFFDLLLDSPTGLLDSTDESISSNAQMDLLLAPDSSSLTASPPSRTPVVMIAHKNGSLIAAEKKFLGKFFGPHLQRTRTG